jgi:hypothetical protein
MKHMTLVAFLLVTAGTASADLLTYMTGAGGSGGTLSWAGGTSALVGTGIHVGLLNAQDTAQNAGFYNVVGPTSSCGAMASCGDLEFSTGAFIGSITSGNTTLLEFASGGTFTLTGGLTTTTGGSTPVGPSTVMLSGAFTGITTYDVVTGTFAAATGSGQATADSTMQSFFGIHTTIQFPFTVQVINSSTPTDPLAAFSQGVSSMQMNTSPVPEATSIILLALVMIGCAAIMFRHSHERRQH